MAYKFYGGGMDGGEEGTGIIAKGKQAIELNHVKVTGKVAADLALTEDSQFVSNESTFKGTEIGVVIRKLEDDWDLIVTQIRGAAKEDGFTEEQTNEIIARLREIKESELSSENKKGKWNSVVGFATSVASGLLVEVLKKVAGLG